MIARPGATPPRPSFKGTCHADARNAVSFQLMRQYYPRGRRLPALERNILKYRAFEMMLVLFHIEHLKNFVLASVRATNRNSLPEGTKNVYAKAWQILVTDGIITEEESVEIQRLIDYRNTIAHSVHQLTGDLSRDSIAEDFIEFRQVRYDYTALKKTKKYRDKISRGMRARYVVSLSFESLVFEAAEKVYEQEIARLAQTINRQIHDRKTQSSDAKAEIKAVAHVLREIEPYHPLNVSRSGALTKRGVEVCHRLFSLGLSTFAVSYVMHISYRAVAKRRRKWEQLGGSLTK